MTKTDVVPSGLTLGTPPNALILARSEGHQSHFGTVSEELLSHLATLNGERPKDLIRAEIVYFETTARGAVFSTGSITFCGSLSHNNYDNNVSRMVENVLRRFAGDAVKFVTSTAPIRGITRP